jgi:hypothetical protein
VYYHAGKPPASADLKAGPLGAASRAGVELAEALSRRAPARPGGSYSYEAPARFTWTLVYSASADVPAIQSGSFARLWLLKQEPFLQRLRSAGIPFQQLDWTVSRVEHAANGEVRPALRTLGEGRVLHVLRQLVRKPGDSGPEPQDAWDDPRYYATAR